MNDEQIEKILKKAPEPKAPADLKEKLRVDIRLPRPGANADFDRTSWSNEPSWMRRWLPALSFAAILLTCIVAFGVQGNLMTELKQHNADLRAKVQNLDSLREDNATLQRMQNENKELDRLRRDNAEMAKLRTEIADLTTQVQGLAALKAQNEQLKARNRPIPTNVAQESANADKAEAERIQCINNMKQIGLAFRIWAGDNGDKYPDDFISMTNELNNWKLLQCPSDKAHQVNSWADVASGNVSYRRVSSGPGVNDSTPNVVLFECPVHGSVGLCDGSVQGLSPLGRQRSLKVVNGVTIFQPPQ